MLPRAVGLLFAITGLFFVLDIGSADAGTLSIVYKPASDGTSSSVTFTCVTGALYTLNNTSSWDFRLGLRWMLQPETPPMIMMPPAPMQPPLMSPGLKVMAM